MCTKCFNCAYPVKVDSQPAPSERIKYISLNRDQLLWQPLDVEQLIGEDHPARIIWEVSGRMNLSRFEAEVKTQEGKAGRPRWSARVLVSVWVYSYTIEIASARAIERMMSHEPGLRWLTACEVINYHTLSDFRVEHQGALEDLFAQFLALLDDAGVVDLRTLLQDGTKVRAVAGSRSLHRRKTLEKQLRTARKLIQKLDQEAVEEGEGMDARQRAAQARAAREALNRAERALQKLQALEAVTPKKERGDLRVSDSEAEARRMKHADGSWAPSYNVQITTEVQGGMVVGVTMSSAANDTQELMPALEQVEKNCGELPVVVIADNGYATRQNVEQTSAQEIELIAPWKADSSREAGACARNGIDEEFVPSKFAVQRGGKKLLCPAGKMLVVIGQKTHHGVRKNVFEAKERECGACPWVKKCCGRKGGPRRIERVVESPAMKKYLARMKRPEVKQLYRQRSRIAEFPHLWAKAAKKWRRFSVRGMAKAGMEALWVMLAYNVTQWIRLGRPEPAIQ